jgi:hypothetical protein
VVTNPAVPEPAVLTKALASVTGGSPYQGVMTRLRTRLFDMAAKADESAAANPDAAMATPDDLYDGNPSGRTPAAPLVPETRPEVPAENVAQTAAGPAAPQTKASSTTKAPTAPASTRSVQAPRDPVPAPAPVSAR